MNAVMTWILVLVTLALIIEGFIFRERFFQFPFLAAMMTFSFILPQAPGVSIDPFMPESAYVKVCLMTVLALLLLRMGWSERREQPPILNQVYSENHLLVAAATFSVIGAYFYVKLSNLPGDISIGVQMSGAPVMYLFFAWLLVYGLTIAVLCFVRRPSTVAGFIIAVDVSLYLERILIIGKRAETLELALIFALALWFYRGWLVPRWAMLLLLVAGIFGTTSMADYREITRRNASFEWDAIRKIDVIDNFDKLLKFGGPELRNAVVRIDYIDRTQEFDYGATHWNRLVFNYVPAQLVGTKLKASLMLTVPSAGRDYNPLTGTTETGMTEAFQSFWYFGALKFMLLAYVLSLLWASANAGSTTAQIVYILSIVPGTHAISHSTDWVLGVWVHMIIFLLPVLFVARLRVQANVARAAPSTGLALASPR
jgi:hypothetical protein